MESKKLSSVAVASSERKGLRMTDKIIPINKMTKKQRAQYNRDEATIAAAEQAVGQSLHLLSSLIGHEHIHACFQRDKDNFVVTFIPIKELEPWKK
jgi:hypothetical protein